MKNMANHIIDLTGQKFGMLTVIERDILNSKPGFIMWKCHCECGGERSVLTQGLRQHEVTHCGCKSRINHLEGMKFGRLTVIGRDPSPDTDSSNWLCRCECNNITSVPSSRLKSGDTRSCGCLARELSTKHGMAAAHRIEYNVWKDMMGRCNNPKNCNYHRYGQRGIEVAAEWHDPRNFYRDMGPKPEGMSIDRIDDNGNYEPVNCRWANRITQQNNKRDTTYVEYEGVTLGLAQWARILNINYDTLRNRKVRYDWPVERSFFENNPTLIPVVERKIVTRVPIQNKGVL
jgi:hypothetical protein